MGVGSFGGKAFGFLQDLCARIQIYRKKDISLLHFPVLLRHRKVLRQNMQNFTKLYGSRWEAAKKMNAIIGGNVTRKR